MEIVTGSTGEVHVTPIDDAVRNSNSGYSEDRVVFDFFENFNAIGITANEVRVYSGYGMNQGRIFKIDREEYDTVTIRNGSVGYKRADLIVARYTMNSQTGFEDISLAVIEGQSGTDYVDPVWTTGNINEGDTLDDFPLYRVKLNGIVMDGNPEPLFTPLPDGGRLGELEQKVDTDMIVNLASENSGNLNDCQHEDSLDLGVKGKLPISHGGTNATDVANAAKNIVIGALGNDTNVPTDDMQFITSANNAAFSSVLKKRTAVNVWSYILGKIRSFFEIPTNSSILPLNHGGTGASTASAARTNLGLGSIAVENSPLGLSKGGTGATSAADARTNLGLGNVNNTSDANKPISTATATALSGKAPTSHAVNDNTYGLGTSSVYGHVKLTDTYNPTTASGASSSVGASQKALKDAYQALLTAMGQAGYGDMLKATYDTNNNGVVDKAEKLNIARKLKVNLASTSDVTFDGSADKTGIGVSGTLPVANGGTGNATNVSNSVIVGNGTGALKNIEPSKNSSSIGQGGAFYTPVGTSSDKTPTPRFGTLPAAQGGTGNTSLQATRNAMGLGNTTGALPVANGGTGNTAGYIRTGQKANTTIGDYATAEGSNTTASGEAAHAEGKTGEATGNYSHAEGYWTLASAESAHAEGNATQASGKYSHAEGNATTANGEGAHAEGYGTAANGKYSHAGGYYTLASSDYQRAIGKYNVADTANTYAFIIGKGSAVSRSNGLTVDWSGNLKATSYANISSKRYKENISNMTEEEANKLLELTPVNFDYIGENNPKNQMGLIAEEVAEVMDYPVIREHDVIEGLDYSKFVPALIKLVQMQEKKIEELERRLQLAP